MGAFDLGGFGTATQITGEKKPAGQLVFNRLRRWNRLVLPVVSVGHCERGKNNKLKTDSSGHRIAFQVYCAVIYDVIPRSAAPFRIDHNEKTLSYGNDKMSITEQENTVQAAKPAKSKKDKLIDVFFPDFLDGKPLPSIENLTAITNSCGIRCWYNEMIMRRCIDLPPALQPKGASSRADKRTTFTAASGILANIALRSGAFSYDQAKKMVSPLCYMNPVHPVREWFEAIPKAMVKTDSPAFELLCSTIETPHPEHLRIYLKRQLIAAVAALYESGFWHKQVFVLQGKQNKGKTSWFRRVFGVVPDAFRDGRNLRNCTDKDKVLQLVRHWAVELGELESSMRGEGSEVEDRKAFISSTNDDLRLPYGEEVETLIRQTIFLGTANTMDLLNDSTGNCRFSVITATDFLWDILNKLDMREVWGQALAWYRAGEQWHLTAEEEAMQTELNDEFVSDNPIRDLVCRYFDFSTPEDFWNVQLSPTQIADIIGLDVTNKKQIDELGRVLNELQVVRRNATGETARSFGKIKMRFMPPRIAGAQNIHRSKWNNSAA
ncbi:VapE domain-containing protein [Klebsiella pneumoniae]|uniref:VapE domain-containing protein n=1 Tax=Klebsiella pneumoniae TaxID=573 RepID=UPI0011E4E024|nr:VapE domain-containing protein [Klebsiella pneumoniae]